jgi:23S rRNA-/tRNA-specific pseudouridylate synthase
MGAIRRGRTRRAAAISPGETERDIPAALSFSKERMPLPPVIFEDDSLMVFDKPSGLPVAPDRGDKQKENLMGLVHAQFGRDVANVHRLDADASGLLLCAKTKPALDFLSGQFQSKTVRQLYHALVVILPVDEAMKVTTAVRDGAGTLPATFPVNLPLDQDEERPGCMRVVRKRDGKPCLTEFAVAEAFGRFALVECRPLGSRTHQVRVHLAAAGAPILDDSFYGAPEIKLLLSDLKRGYKGRAEEKPLIDRLALHASEVIFTHPVTREPCTLRAPLPREFEIALKYLRKFQPRVRRQPLAGGL